MSRYLPFAILFFYTTVCISQQKILLIGTNHNTRSNRVSEMIPIVKTVERFHPEIICTEYPIPTDTASIIRKSVMYDQGEKVFERMEALRKEWKIPPGDIQSKIESLKQNPDFAFNIQRQMELQQLYFLSSDAGNADYLGYQIMTKVKKDSLKMKWLDKNYPGFGVMRKTYEIKCNRNDEYYHLVFPLAVKSNISYLYPIDDLSTWKEYERYYNRIQVSDTIDVNTMKYRKRIDDFLKKLKSLSKDSNQWLFSNSRQIVHDLLYVEAYEIDVDVTADDVRMLQHYWALRNKTMAQHIDAVARLHPHSDIAVFFGFSHVGPVQEELNRLEEKDYQILTLFDVLK